MITLLPSLRNLDFVQYKYISLSIHLDKIRITDQLIQSIVCSCLVSQGQGGLVNHIHHLIQLPWLGQSKTPPSKGETSESGVTPL